jgi:hypothetical protein
MKTMECSHETSTIEKELTHNTMKIKKLKSKTKK